MARLCALLAVTVTPACKRETAVGAAHPSRLVMLGIDGMDPVLTQKYLDEGRLPNLRKLIDNGGHFQNLGTTNPPQSPVAWSSVITGLHTSGHGIFDFVHRDAHDVSPYLSTSRTREPTTLTIGPWEIPLGSPEIELLREGDAFWQILERQHVPATVIKIPANFPPAKSQFNVSTSGMGTPDLMGTYGTFQLITSDAALNRPRPGGIIALVKSSEDGVYRTHLVGPPNPSAPDEPLKVAVLIAVDTSGEKHTAALSLGDRDVVLTTGEWSAWLPIEFDPGMTTGNLAGMVRLFAKRLSPELEIYASPINLDPLAPAMPLSSPEDYVTMQAEKAGRFYTQGMAQDTKALSGGVLSDPEFLQQADIVLQEELRLLDVALDQFKGGLLFYYVSSIDQVCHVFWRTLEPDAAPEVAKYAHVIPDLYTRIDAAIGKVMERVGKDTPILIMSDHGFAPYRYKVNLNAWLANNGYLTLHPSGTRGDGPLGHIDWSQTQAYALGLNQLFLNVAGREPGGVVTAQEKPVLLARLKRELESWYHTDTGNRVITRVAQPAAGTFTERAPDLLIGYNRGYRSSDDSAMGAVQGDEVERNLGEWSGDHCMDPEHVPGVLITSVGMQTQEASLIDLVPTLLHHFGTPIPAALPGKNLWAKKP